MTFSIAKIESCEYKHLSTHFVCDAESKHIALATPASMAIELKKLADVVGYKYCFMSDGDNFDPKFVVKSIYRMYESGFNRPVKYILTSDGRIWSDNTHTSILYAFKYGFDVKIFETDYYIVDVRKTCPVIFLGSQSISEKHFIPIIKNALAVETRVRLGWRPRDVRYTIGDLCLYDCYLERLQTLYAQNESEKFYVHFP